MQRKHGVLPSHFTLPLEQFSQDWRSSGDFLSVAGGGGDVLIVAFIGENVGVCVVVVRCDVSCVREREASFGLETYISPIRPLQKTECARRGGWVEIWGWRARAFCVADSKTTSHPKRLGDYAFLEYFCG